MVTRVKICGLRRAQDAELAMELGADALGFVLEPSSPRHITRDDLAWIAGLGPFALKVAVYAATVSWTSPGTFQLVQGLETVEASDPSKFLDVVRLRDGDSAADVLSRPTRGAALVLDAYRTDALGGTGHRVDWGLAAEIVAGLDHPVVLAGGLTPDNVAEAIRVVNPYAVDVSSGVESEVGAKDPAKLRDFVQAVRGSS